MSCSEYTEGILSSLVVSLAQLCKALRAVPVPQKWLGSSIALLFDVGSLPSPSQLQAAGLSSLAPLLPSLMLARSHMTWMKV